MTDTMKIAATSSSSTRRRAPIAAWDTRAWYRVESSTASNAIEFMKPHRALCFAMQHGHPEELATADSKAIERETMII